MTESPRPAAIGRYHILDLIAEGGMGRLYRARDPQLGRLLAIKVLRSDNPDLRARFAREASLAASLRHPHIVVIFDVGDHDGQPFMAMEYIQGRTLADIIAAREAMTLPRKLQLIAELCDGLAYAHRHRLIHRDVKPANAIVEGDDGPLKIVDFGIARGADQPGLTQDGMTIGTPHYMSPEQALAKPIDHRSDIFAVGAVLYELVSYQRAFSGSTTYEVLNKIVQSRREPLEAICPDVPAELVRIVDRALEPNPGKRYDDLAEMQADLERVRRRLDAPAPTIALRPPFPPPAPPAPPTKPRWLSLAVAAMVVVVVGVATGAWRWYAASTPAPVARLSPAEPTKPQQVPPALPAVKSADEARPVSEALERYAAASGRMDARAVALVRTDVTADDIASNFARYRDYHLAITGCAIDVSGNTATARCSETRRFTPLSGDVQTHTEAVAYALRRGVAGSTWRITSRVVQ